MKFNIGDQVEYLRLSYKDDRWSTGEVIFLTTVDGFDVVGIQPAADYRLVAAVTRYLDPKLVRPATSWEPCPGRHRIANGSYMWSSMEREVTS